MGHLLRKMPWLKGFIWAIYQPCILFCRFISRLIGSSQIGGDMSKSVRDPMNKDSYSFSKAQDDFEKFETLLRTKGIPVVPNSDLERLGLSVYDLLFRHEHPEIQNSNDDIRPFVREALGLNDLVGKVLKIKGNPSFGSLLDHFRLLNKGNPQQNAVTLVTDQASNKLFELLIACALMVHSDEVSLAHPDLENTDNPDVLARFGKALFGFACKVPHSPNGKTLFGNVRKAVEQINRSKADVGVVIMNLKNLLNHDDLWPILNETEWKNGAEPLFSGYLDSDDATNKLRSEVDQIVESIASEISKEDLVETFFGGKALPAIVFYVPTVVGTVVGGRPQLTSLGFLNMYEFGEIGADERIVLELLNDGFQLKQRLRIEGR